MADNWNPLTPMTWLDGPPAVDAADMNAEIRDRMQALYNGLVGDVSVDSAVVHRHDSGLYSARPAAGSAGKLYEASDVGLFEDNGSKWRLIRAFTDLVQYEREDFRQYDATATVGRYVEAITGAGQVSLEIGEQSIVRVRNGAAGDYAIFADIVKQLPLFTSYPYWFEHRLVVDTTNIHALLGALDSMPAGATLPNEMIGFFVDTATNANWWALTRSNGGAETNQTDTGVAVSATTHQRLAVEVTGAAAIKFYVDDVLKATHAPTVMPVGAARSFSYRCYSSAAANRDLIIDSREYWWTRAA